MCVCVLYLCVFVYKVINPSMSPLAPGEVAAGKNGALSVCGKSQGEGRKS